MLISANFPVIAAPICILFMLFQLGHSMQRYKKMNTPSETADFGSIPQYHMSMLNDRERNSAYKRALRKSIIPNESVVLDIGAGTGLLSLYAASAQAKMVIAVEHNPELLRIGNKTVYNNHLQDRIVYYHLDSSEIPNTIPTDACQLISSRTPSTTSTTGSAYSLPPCETITHIDILVTELFDSWILGELILPVLADLYHRGIIDHHTQIIPDSATLSLQLIQSVYSFPTFPPSIDGYDYTAYEAIDRYSFTEIVIAAHTDVTAYASPVLTPFHFDFQEMEAYTDIRYAQLAFPIHQTVVIHGILCWFTMNLLPVSPAQHPEDEGITLSNTPHTSSSSTFTGIPLPVTSPVTPSLVPPIPVTPLPVPPPPPPPSHWKQMFAPFQEDIPVYAGTLLSVQMVQLPRRYILVPNVRGQRLVKFMSHCEVATTQLHQHYGIDIYRIHTGKVTGNEENEVTGNGNGNDVTGNKNDVTGNNNEVTGNCVTGNEEQCTSSDTGNTSTTTTGTTTTGTTTTGTTSSVTGISSRYFTKREYLFSMEGSYFEVNYWKGRIGQTFVAVIVMSEDGRESLETQYTVPEDVYDYHPGCTTEGVQCPVQDIQLAIFDIFCPRQE